VNVGDDGALPEREGRLLEGVGRTEAAVAGALIVRWMFGRIDDDEVEGSFS
jgi:hypothetical protein